MGEWQAEDTATDYPRGPYPTDLIVSEDSQSLIKRDLTDEPNPEKFTFTPDMGPVDLRVNYGLNQPAINSQIPGSALGTTEVVGYDNRTAIRKGGQETWTTPEGNEVTEDYYKTGGKYGKADDPHKDSDVIYYPDEIHTKKPDGTWDVTARPQPPKKDPVLDQIDKLSNTSPEDVVRTAERKFGVSLTQSPKEQAMARVSQSDSIAFKDMFGVDISRATPAMSAMFRDKRKSELASFTKHYEQQAAQAAQYIKQNSPEELLKLKKSYLEVKKLEEDLKNRTPKQEPKRMKSYYNAEGKYVGEFNVNDPNLGKLIEEKGLTPDKPAKPANEDSLIKGAISQIDAHIAKNYTPEIKAERALINLIATGKGVDSKGKPYKDEAAKSNAIQIHMKRIEDMEQKRDQALATKALIQNKELHPSQVVWGGNKESAPTDSAKESEFDPEGTGYDYETAKMSGLKPDASGHWPSRDPLTGQILKGKKHETFSKTEEGEKVAGHTIIKASNGRYYSYTKDKLPTTTTVPSTMPAAAPKNIGTPNKPVVPPVTVPPMVNQQTLVDEANKAIQGGANPDLVMKRLKEKYGIEVKMREVK